MSADKLQQRLPKSYPLLDSPDPSKTQRTVGTVLSIDVAPRQPEPNYSGQMQAKDTITDPWTSATVEISVLSSATFDMASRMC